MRDGRGQVHALTSQSVPRSKHIVFDIMIPAFHSPVGMLVWDPSWLSGRECTPLAGP